MLLWWCIMCSNKNISIYPGPKIAMIQSRRTRWLDLVADGRNYKRMQNTCMKSTSVWTRRQTFGIDGKILPRYLGETVREVVEGVSSASGRNQWSALVDTKGTLHFNRAIVYYRGLQPLLSQGPHFNGKKICGTRERFTKQSLHITAGHTNISLHKHTNDTFLLFIYGL